MNSKLCFIFATFCFTGILIFTIHLRSTNDRIFYKLYKQRTKQAQLKQQLWRKQLQLENMINPAAISQQLEP